MSSRSTGGNVGPSWSDLESSWGDVGLANSPRQPCGVRCRAILGPVAAILGPVEAVLGHLEACWGPSIAHRGQCWDQGGSSIALQSQARRNARND